MAATSMLLQTENKSIQEMVVERNAHTKLLK
jgi:hypothetical protein